jgi:opacity protein-like surface antigen
LKSESLRLTAYPSHLCFLLAAMSLATWAMTAAAQTHNEGPFYARSNAFGVFGAYSGDSSHMLLGVAENRRLLEIGVSYSRRLIVNHFMNWQYDGEIMPVVLESDPLGQVVENQTSPTASTFTYGSGPAIACAQVTIPYSETDPANGITYSGTLTVSCNGHRWTDGEAMSPAGMRWNFLPTRKVQPFVDGHGGYMFSTQQIPVTNSGSFNFTFDIGAGVEIYRSRTRSIRAEYRYHHFSNDNTAQMNPGVDNGLFQVTYCFGR